MRNEHQEKRLQNLRYILTGRKTELQEEIARWDRPEPSAGCSAHPDCPICLLRTELEIVNRYLDCVDRQLFHVGSCE